MALQVIFLTQLIMISYGALSSLSVETKTHYVVLFVLLFVEIPVYDTEAFYHEACVI